MTKDTQDPLAHFAPRLQARIDAEVARILGSASPSQSVIFTGNRLESVPTQLISDPILEPVDKLVWMVLSSTRVGNDIAAVLPSYEDLLRLANIRGRATLARALAILRITRWLTLCRKVRDERGRFRGNVYALHDEPSLLADSLLLDPSYLPFLQKSSAHSHRRVQWVARQIQDSLDEDVAGFRHAEAVPPLAEQRMQTIDASNAHTVRPDCNLTAPNDVRVNKNSGFLKDLSDRVQILNLDHRNVRRQDGKDERSGFLKTKPLAPNGAPKVDANTDSFVLTVPFVTMSGNVILKSYGLTIKNVSMSADRAADVSLHFPARFNASHRALACKYLESVAPDQRQALLDELAGRLAAERYGARPVWDAVQYLAELCKRAQLGTFQANLGHEVRAARERLARQIAAARNSAVKKGPKGP